MYHFDKICSIFFLNVFGYKRWTWSKHAWCHRCTHTYFFKYICLACSSMNPHYCQFGIDNLHTLKNTNVERLTFCQHSVGTVQLWYHTNLLVCVFFTAWNCLHHYGILVHWKNVWNSPTPNVLIFSKSFRITHEIELIVITGRIFSKNSYLWWIIDSD